MLDLLVDLGWKSALIAALALSGVLPLGQGSAAQRVLLVRVALAALLALPLFAIALPALELALLPPAPPPEVAMALTTTPTLARIQMAAPAAGFDADALVTPVYGLGAALVLAWLAIGLWTLRRWTRAAAPLDDPGSRAAIAAAQQLRRPVRLRVSRHVASPLSWGVAPAWILVDRDTAARPERLGPVIAHELAHVRRFDWPVLVAAQVTVALYWFNPLVWLLVRELSRQSELAADEDAVRWVARADYAQTLLAVANRPRAHVHANGMALNRTQLARRIMEVLEGHPRRPARPVVFALLLAGGFAASAPLAAMRLVHAAPQRAAASPVPIAPRMTAPVDAAASSRPAASVAAPAEAWKTVPPAGASPATATAPVPAPVRVSAPVIVDVPVRVALPVAVAPQSAPAARAVEDAEDVEEARREAAAGRRETAQELREQAAEMYKQANELERNANETGQPADARQGMLGGVHSMRDAARGLEAQAAQLIAQ